MTMLNRSKTTARVRVEVAYGPVPSITGDLMKVMFRVSSLKRSAVCLLNTLKFSFLLTFLVWAELVALSSITLQNTRTR